MSDESYEAEIAALHLKLAEAERERDRYRAALWQYAGPVNWQVRDSDGEECEWIGEGAGPNLAEKALAGVKGSGGTNQCPQMTRDGVPVAAASIAAQRTRWPTPYFTSAPKTRSAAAN